MCQGIDCAGPTRNVWHIALGGELFEQRKMHKRYVVLYVKRAVLILLVPDMEISCIYLKLARAKTELMIYLA